MRKGIHPEYKLTKITCQCGNVIETRSTVENINVEICSACHPFYTGKQKLVDTAGRIDRFNKRFGLGADGYAAVAKKNDEKAAAKKAEKAKAAEAEKAEKPAKKAPAKKAEKPAEEAKAE